MGKRRSMPANRPGELSRDGRREKARGNEPRVRGRPRATEAHPQTRSPNGTKTGQIPAASARCRGAAGMKLPVQQSAVELAGRGR